MRKLTSNASEIRRRSALWIGSPFAQAHCLSADEPESTPGLSLMRPVCEGGQVAELPMTGPTQVGRLEPEQILRVLQGRSVDGGRQLAGGITCPFESLLV